jgi:small subunit ribosomal protein S20
LALSSRTWTGARSPQGKKRVRQAARRNAVLQPRRSAAKTLVRKAQVAATAGDAEQTQTALLEAVSALDRAAKVGAIHPNAAARRKSRLMLKVNAALGGEATISTGKAARQTSKAQATKAAKARIAAGKASKAKGEQTAAGKARAALSKTTREAAAEAEAPKATATTATTKAAAKTEAQGVEGHLLGGLTPGREPA